MTRRGLPVAAPASSRLPYVQATNALQSECAGCSPDRMLLNLPRNEQFCLCNILKLPQKDLLHIDQRCVFTSEGTGVLLLSPRQRHALHRQSFSGLMRGRADTACSASPRCLLQLKDEQQMTSRQLRQTFRASLKQDATSCLSQARRWRGTPSSPTYVEYLPLHLD